MPKTLSQIIAEAEEKFDREVYKVVSDETRSGFMVQSDPDFLKAFLRTSLTELAQSFADSIRVEKKDGLYEELIPVLTASCPEHEDGNNPYICCGGSNRPSSGACYQLAEKAIDELNAKIDTFLSEGVKSTKQDSLE